MSDIDQLAAFRATIQLAESRGMPEHGGHLGLTHLRNMYKQASAGGFNEAKLGRWLGWAQCAVVAAAIGFGVGRHGRDQHSGEDSMSFVDVVAEAIWRADDDAVQSSWGFVNMRERGRYKHMAEAAISVCRPRVVSTEQLDALPDDTTVLVDDVPARKHLGDWYFANDDGDGYPSSSLALYLPAVVLWTPETGEQ